MNTPSPKFFCPQCGGAFSRDVRYCGKCGADMHSASGLRYADRTEKLRQSRGRGLKVNPTGDTEAVDAVDIAGDSDSSDSWDGNRDRRNFRDEWMGRVIDSRYRVVEVIGSGGMGVVYKVEHLRMGKIAAMKVLHGELAHDEEVIGRFRREAAAVSQLHHPNTVQVFDFGTSHGALYLIMEYVSGVDLGTLVKRDGPLPFDRAAPLFGQICAALCEAHELGIVHRDLKPENILVTRTHRGRDFVKVLDFGLAKLSEHESRAEVTDRGSIVGTPYYMSPEQIRGDDIDARSDIYSLGAMMYRVLTGQPPYTAKTPIGVLTKHLTAELMPPSERAADLPISPGVDRIVCRAMEKEAGDRWPSISAVLDAIEQLYVDEHSGSASSALPGLSWSATASSRVSTSGGLSDRIDYGIDNDLRLQRSDLDEFERSLRRGRIIGVAIVPVLLLVVAGMLLYLFVLRQPQPRTSEAEPNNERSDATLIQVDTKVTGHLGKRISTSEPDRDYYRVKQTPGRDGKTAVTVELTGLPNMDVDLAVLDENGRRLAHANAGGIGAGEIIHRYRVDAPIYVAIGQVKPEGPSLPIENVSDKYTLRVTYEAADATTEVEPDNTPSDAIELRLDQTIRGYLDRRVDRDVFVFRGARGKYRLAIGGASSVPLQWQLGSAHPRTKRAATVALEPGSCFCAARSVSVRESSCRG